MPDRSDPGPPRFPSTQHSIIAALGADEPTVREPAVEAVVTTYWKPVYRYLRVARGVPHEDAEDLTQDFFVHALERDTLASWDPARARFRTFLRVCLDHFAANARKAAGRLKRGGGLVAVPLDLEGIERSLAPAGGCGAGDPEAFFRREWIRALFEGALDDVTALCAEQGKATPLAVFLAYDVDPPDEAGRPTYDALARRFGVPATQITNYLALVRRQFRRGRARAAARRVRHARGVRGGGAGDLRGGAVSRRELADAAITRLEQVVRAAPFDHPRYSLGEVIASGGMGTVYRARDQLLERDVAIKLVRGTAPDPALAARLEQEARILAGLDHPGLVPVHDLGVLADGRAYYVMRLVEGKRLDQHLESVPSLAERLRLFLKVCEPVAFAHAKGVVHRDLKPANIMVGPFGEVLVLDWGIAKVRERSTAEELGSPSGPVHSGATGPGAVLGTAGFMAPEQAGGGSSEVDERADVYALGAILRELLAGRPSVPRRLLAIRDRAMAPPPEERYPTARALAVEVTRFLDGVGVEAYRESPLERAGRFLARHKIAITLILAYLVMRMALLLFARS